MNTPKNRAIMFFASGTYLGYMPVASGTFGTLWGIPVFFGISKLVTPAAVVVVAAIIIVSIYLADEAAKLLGKKDPGKVVCDEIAGFAAATLFIPFNLTNVILSFILFRFFDILKPYPVGLLDKRVPGGLGIVLDDVAAGIYANILAQVVIKYVL